jgi:hypothetical protein
LAKPALSTLARPASDGYSGCVRCRPGIGGVDNSIGRITTAGVVSNYTGTGIDGADGITTGSDGAVWFTNFDDTSIGRITVP